jgi:transposase
MSGQTVRYGRITKRGNSYLRALLVQGAWALSRAKAGGKLKERYEYMTKEKSISKKKAIVAIARRLAEEMYTLLRDGTRHEFRPFTPGKKKVKEIAKLALGA